MILLDDLNPSIIDSLEFFKKGKCKFYLKTLIFQMNNGNQSVVKVPCQRSPMHPHLNLVSYQMEPTKVRLDV